MQTNKQLSVDIDRDCYQIKDQNQKSNNLECIGNQLYVYFWIDGKQDHRAV
jgi:hypothetical protein